MSVMTNLSPFLIGASTYGKYLPMLSSFILAHFSFHVVPSLTHALQVKSRPPQYPELKCRVKEFFDVTTSLKSNPKSGMIIYIGSTVAPSANTPLSDIVPPFKVVAPTT